MTDRFTARSAETLKFPAWQREFEAALLETDAQKLPEQLKAAETAIFLRQQELDHSADGNIERQAMDDAMQAIHGIQIEKLGYPDWK